MSAPTLARSHGARTAHLLEAALPHKTMCGKDASRMARWAPADGRVDSKLWPVCAKCRAEHSKRYTALIEAIADEYEYGAELAELAGDPDEAARLLELADRNRAEVKRRRAR